MVEFKICVNPVRQVLKKLNIELPYDPENSTSGHLPQWIENKYVHITCTQMSIAALSKWSTHGNNTNVHQLMKKQKVT